MLLDLLMIAILILLIKNYNIILIFFFYFVKDTKYTKKEIRKSILLNIEAEENKTENSLFSKKHSNK